MTEQGVDTLIRRAAARFFVERHIEPATVAFAVELRRRYEDHELEAMHPPEIAALAAAFFRKHAAERFTESVNCN